MKGNDKLTVYLGTFIFVIVGYFLSLWISDILSDVLSSLSLPFLTATRILGIIAALAWLIVSFLTYWGGTRWIEEGAKIGLISLFFFILWFVAAFAVVIGFIIHALLIGGSATINLDNLLDTFFTFGLLWGLAPTISALLGVSNKSH